MKDVEIMKQEGISFQDYMLAQDDFINNMDSSDIEMTKTIVGGIQNNPELFAKLKHFQQENRLLQKSYLKGKERDMLGYPEQMRKELRDKKIDNFKKMLLSNPAMQELFDIAVSKLSEELMD